MKTKIYSKITTPVLAILALILCGAAITFAQTLPLRANGKIAFASTQDGIWEIYSINSDGSGQRRLTYSIEDGAFLPSWSPNGRKIAYVNITNFLDPYYHLRMMNADGSNQTTLTTVFTSHPIGISLSWSPDGRKIAFNSAGDIYTINVDGSNLVNLTNHPAHDGEPSWSPDGSRIAFTSNRTSSPFGIHIMNADGSNVQQYPPGNFSFAPKWSPNGERLLFLNPGYDFGNILYSGNISGSSLITLGGGIESADWSPDGTKVVIESSGIGIINATGGGFIQIRPANASKPDWQPLPVPTLADFDGDGKSDISVFRPSDRVWYLNQSTAGFSATQFGLSSDKITPADFDGDGKTDISVFREGVWYRLNSSNGTVGITQFGIAGDIPQPADFDGNGRAELAVYRNGTWYSYNLANNQVNTIQFGISTDKPVVADYDGDGRADQAVYRGNGEWHLNRSSQGYTVVNFGLSTDKLVPADYDGDGKTDQAVYRNGTWYLLQSSQGFTAFQFGLSTDIPAPADYDGDDKTDAAVFRDGTWYLLQSTNGISIQQFGLANDQPVPGINAGNNGFIDGVGTSESLSKKESEVVLATKTWDGGGATENWNEAANWSGDTVPLSADSVVFDATSVKNVTIDVNITVSAWQIAAGYTGTISQGTSTVTVNGSFSQSGGTFTGGSVLLDFNQPFTQSGGTFTASSGTTSFASSLNLSGGTFNHNNGTIVFDNSSSLTLPAMLNLNNLTVNGNGIFQTNSTIFVPGTLTLTNGFVSNTTVAITGIINATGNVSIASTFDGGTTNVLIDGVLTRTVTFPAGAIIPRLTVNSANVMLDTSGSGNVTFQNAVDLQNIVGFTYSTNLTFQGAFSYGASTTMSGSGNITMGLFLSFTQSNGTITLLGTSTFTQSSGTFTQSGGTFIGGSGLIDFNVFTQSGGTFTASSGTTSFAAATTISGTFNHNGGTVVFDGSSSAGITLSAPLDLNNLTINSPSFLVLDNGLINVAGTLNLTNGSIATNGGGIVNALGNVSIAAAYDGGSATLLFSGAANQTYSDAGGIKPSGIWTINKSGGTLTLNNDLNISNGGSNSLNLTDGTITTGANTVIAGTRTITRTNGFINGNLRRTFSAVSSRQFDVGTVNGYAPVTINATAGAFPATFTVGGKNGTLPDADTTKSLTRNWSLTPNGITSANLTFQYLETDVPISANENNFKFLRHNGTISNEGITSINTATNIATLNGVTNFSDWSLGLLVPLAANAAISGRVMTANGQAIARARVSITDSNGETHTTLTSSFGYYRFDEIRVGETYIIQPQDKRYRFTPQIITLNEDLEELNFIAD